MRLLLAAAISITACTGSRLPNVEGERALRCAYVHNSLGATIQRCENDEVICYVAGSDKAMQCAWKEEPSE